MNKKARVVLKGKKSTETDDEEEKVLSSLGSRTSEASEDHLANAEADASDTSTNHLANNAKADAVVPLVECTRTSDASTDPLADAGSTPLSRPSSVRRRRSLPSGARVCGSARSSRS